MIDDHVRAEVRAILAEIRDGSFAQEWVAENRAGRIRFNQLRAANAARPVEKVGAELRAMMPFVAAGRPRIQDLSCELPRGARPPHALAPTSARSGHSGDAELVADRTRRRHGQLAMARH